MILNVIVAGAGIAGLTLSLGLAKLGYSVDLVERRHDMRKRGGGPFGLQPNALKALREICPEVVESIKDQGVPMDTGGTMFMWWIVRDALFNEVAKYPSQIKLHLGWTFSESVDDTSNPFVLAKFTRTDDDGQEKNGHDDLDGTLEVKGLMLIGADGVHSSVRSALNLPPAEYTGAVLWRGTIFVPEDSKVLSPLLNKGVVALSAKCGPTLIALSNHNNRAMCWGMGSQDPDALTKAHPMEVIEPFVDSSDETLEIMQAVFELSDPEAVQRAIKCETIKPPEEDGKGWGGKGRVTLVGDAAHAMRAVGSLGSSLALEDCVILIRLLKEFGIDSTKDCLAIENLCQQCENSRLPRVRKIWNNQQQFASKIYKVAGTSLNSDEKEFLKWVYDGV